MPLILAASLFDDTSARRKCIDLFSYTSTAQDLLDGNILEMTTGTTYGLGKQVQRTSGAHTYVVGPVDHAVDASAYADLAGVHRLVQVVTAGVKVNAITDGTVAQWDTLLADASGQGSPIAAGTYQTCFGMALEADSGTGAGSTCDVMVYPRVFV